MILPKPSPPLSQAAFAGTFVAPPEPWRAPTRGAYAAITLSGGKGGPPPPPPPPDNPASCASACQYCAPNQRCLFSNACQQRYGSGFPWGCYY